MKSRIKMMDLNQTSNWIEFHVFIFGRFATTTTHCVKFSFSFEFRSFRKARQLSNVSQDVLTEKIWLIFTFFLLFDFRFR